MFFFKPYIYCSYRHQQYELLSVLGWFVDVGYPTIPTGLQVHRRRLHFCQAVEVFGCQHVQNFPHHTRLLQR